MTNSNAKSKAYIRKMESLAFKSFVNALEFNNDSAVLLMLGSFPSASFASLHAQEELGKMFLIDDLCRDIEEGTKTIEQSDAYLRKSIMKDHILKQFFFGVSVGKIAQFEMYVNNPRLIQELRNASLYAAYNPKTGRSVHPSKKITIKKALYQIRFVNGALMDLLDYAYEMQHKGEDIDYDDAGLENNTVINDFYMVDEACAQMNNYKQGDKIEVSRDLLEYFELIKNEISDKRKIQTASFKLLRAARLYQRHRKVKRFIKF